MAKQFGFNQGFRNGSAINFQKRGIFPIRQGFNGIGDHLFSNPGFSEYQNGTVQGSHPGHLLHNPFKPGIRPHHLILNPLTQFLGQFPVIVCKLIFQVKNLLVSDTV